MKNTELLRSLLDELSEIQHQLDTKYHLCMDGNGARLIRTKCEIQRKISLFAGLETAVLLDWKYPWDVGAPFPHVLSNHHETFLIYRLKTPPDPGWDGATIRIVTGKEPMPVAVVKFQTRSFRFGVDWNEDNVHVHKLADRGLEAYRAHEIANSHWIQELKEADSRCDPYDLILSRNDETKHYFFAFHDDYFECLAYGYTVEVIEDRSLSDVVAECAKKIFCEP